MCTRPLEQNLDILVDELVTNDKLRHAFFFSPLDTLRRLAEHSMALTEDEVHALCGARRRIWERVADTLRRRLAQAA